MKKLYPILFAALIFALSCKKERSTDDNGCISRVTELPTVSAADNAAALTLLHDSQVSTTHLVIFRIITNDAAPGPVQPSVNYRFIYANQVFNGLPLLLGDVGFTFDNNGILQSTIGQTYDAVNLDTKSTLSLPRLRTLYLDEAIKMQGITGTMRDSCLVAQFGYYNPINGSGAAPTFMKAWMVKPAHSEYPQAIFRDDNGQNVYFSAGFVLF